MNNQEQSNQPDQKDLIMNQLSINAGNEVATLLQRNAQLTVIAAQLQQENKQLKGENQSLKSRSDEVVVSGNGKED